MKNKTLAFFSTHIINRAVISEYIKCSKVTECDCVLAIDNTKLKIPSETPVAQKEFYGAKVNCFLFDRTIQDQMNLPWFFRNRTTDKFSEVMWYNGDYRFYYVRKYFPDYDYYWQFEYDIFCNGDSYYSFFDKYIRRNVDSFILHFRKEQINGYWMWSKNIEWSYKDVQIYGSLFPVIGLRGNAIDFLYNRRLIQRNNYQKIINKDINAWPFCEMFVPTELCNNGFTVFKIEEPHIRLKGEYDLNECRLFEHPDNLLYHPVKGQFIERIQKLNDEKAFLKKELLKFKENN